MVVGEVELLRWAVEVEQQVQLEPWVEQVVREELLVPWEELEEQQEQVVAVEEQEHSYSPSVLVSAVLVVVGKLRYTEMWVARDHCHYTELLQVVLHIVTEDRSWSCDDLPLVTVEVVMEPGSCWVTSDAAAVQLSQHTFCHHGGACRTGH